MKLIDILVHELPKRGGWPECCYALVQGSSGAVYLAGGGMPLWKFHLAEDWELAEVTREQYEAALAAAQPQWDGEGLPPVGCVCEYTKQSLPGDGWTGCTVDYVGSSFVVYRDCYGVELTGIKGDISFRPIRSQADKKRSDICDKIYGAITKAEREGNRSDMAEAVYDAIAAGEIPHIRIE